MKNIIVLTDKYYPDMSAPSAVIDKYIQELKNDYSFYILTITYRKGFVPYSANNINVRYVTDWWHEARIKAEENCRKEPKSKIRRFIIQLFRFRTFLLSYFCYPLSTQWEIKGYYNELKRLSTEIKIDAVISVSSTITTQFAARKYKKDNPQVKWITFFTDPFTYHYIYYPLYYPFRNLRKKKNFRNELDIYNTADYNLLTEELYNIAVERFNQQQNKTFKIKFVLQDIQKQVSDQKKEDLAIVKLVYAGALYKTIRNPEYMLSVLSQINGVSLDLYTSITSSNECGSIIEKYESERIHVYPPKDRTDYLDMICHEYDILVNIGNNSSNQTPSKTLELLSTGRPILNFYYNRDSQYEMIEKYPLGMNVGRDDRNAPQKVKDFCIQNKGKRLLFEDVESLFPENSLSLQVNKIKNLIEA